MKKLLLSAIFGVAFLAACNTSPTPTQKALGVLEVSINTDGVSTARLESTLSGQSVTYRESDVVFGTGTTQVVSPTGSAYTYLVASFPVSHTGSSTLPFNNLTLYAIAKSGNVGDTAIKSISNFGGVTDLTEQARLAKLEIPVTPVQTSGTGIAISADADFQAFTIGEVSNATIATGIGFNDKILNYGFAARCLTTCTNNSRQIPTNGTGQIKIAVRVPKSSGTYGFIMNFVVLNETDSRVTRSVFPPESVADAQTRGLSVTATRLMQFGLNRTQTSQTLGNDFVDDVFTSRQNASIQALGIGRIDAGDAHSCGLNAIGKAYCWGRGADGQLGNNGSTDSSIPVAVVAVTGLATNTLNFSSISTGDAHMSARRRAQIAHRGGEGRERVQAIAEFLQAERLHMELHIGRRVTRIRACEHAELRGRHAQRSAPEQRVFHPHPRALEQVCVIRIQRAHALNFINRAKLEVVLQIRANARPINQRRYAQRVQIARPPDAGEHQQLWRCNRARRENDPGAR